MGVVKFKENVSSIGEIFKAAAELLKSGKEAGLAHALSAAGGLGLGPVLATLAGVAAVLKPVLSIIEQRAKDKPADEAGKEILTATFLGAAVAAIRLTGRPDTKTPFDNTEFTSEEIEDATNPEYFGSLAGFNPAHPTNHPFYRFAEQGLDTMLAALEYSRTERRMVSNKVEEYFLDLWRDAKTDRESQPHVTRFEEWAKQNPASFLETIQMHIQLQRWAYREKRLLGKENFSLRDVYVKTDCTVSTGETLRQQRNWTFRPRSAKPVMEEIEALMTDPDFHDMILIEAPPGYGKSALTLFASDYLYSQGLRPLRIRIRDLPIIEKQGLWELLESRIAWVPPEEPQPKELGIARVDKPFQDGTIFTTSRLWGEAEICPYILILDGWDEVAAGSTSEYRERLRFLLRELRRIFIERGDPRMAGAAQMRVILTGRPADDLFPLEVLTRGLRVFSLQPFTPVQLQQFYEKLKRAVGRFGTGSGKGTDWPANPRWDQLGKAVDLFAGRSESVLGYPLLAHLTLWLYSKRLAETPVADVDDLLTDTTALYRQLADLTCEEAGKADFEIHNTQTRELHKAAGTYLRDLLRRTAAASYCSGQSGPVSYEELKKYLPRTHKLKRSPATDDVNPLSELLVSYYFSTEHPERGCEFVHKGFAEYLYAEAIVEWMKAAPAKGFTSAAELTEEELNDPAEDESVAWLLRCFAANTLSDQVLKHLLRLVDWEIRRSVKEQPSDRGQTQPETQESWINSGNVMQAVLNDIEENRFLAAGPELGVPPYYLLSRILGAEIDLAKLDARIAAAWLSATGILADALFQAGLADRMRLSQSREHINVLQRAALSGARVVLRSARLASASLANIRLDNVDLRGAELERGNLSQSEIRSCSMQGVNLSSANLERAVISSDLSGADLSRANLRFARMHESRIVDGKFDLADLEHADLSAVSMEGADLSEAKNLTQRQVDRMFGDDSTKLPPGIRRPGSWRNERHSTSDWDS